METIEFYNKTQYKSVKSLIGARVQQELKQYDSNLKERQNKLRYILEMEDLQYQDESTLLMNERRETAFQQRLNWINTKTMERHQANEELLKLKEQQRELENSEEWRHMQTRQLLLETKEAQLYQINEKINRKKEEALIEQKWLGAMERLRQEKEYQSMYEEKLRKVIEEVNQTKNLEIKAALTQQQQTESEEFKNFFNTECKNALLSEEKLENEHKLQAMLDKIKQKEGLKSQIEHNQVRRQQEYYLDLNNHLKGIQLENEQDLTDYDQNVRQKVRNVEWHKNYLQHCLEGRQQRRQEIKEFEDIYLGTGCVLQQTRKHPYGNDSR